MPWQFHMVAEFCIKDLIIGESFIIVIQPDCFLRVGLNDSWDVN